MIEFKMRVAGRVVAVSAMHDSTRTYCEAYLCDDAPDYAVAITSQDIAFEREKSIREQELEGRMVQVFPDPYLEVTAVQRKAAEWLLEDDVLLFHGSVVAVDGVAYLFTAQSGTGKSTHTRLWRELLGDRAVMVNDDKPFLRVSEQGVIAYGTPWNGKHRLGSNTAVPLRAICILERGTENRIRRIPAKQAVGMLLQQSNRPMNRLLLPQYLTLLDKLAGQVVFYQLACNMDLQAAAVAYEAMAEIRKDVEA